MSETKKLGIVTAYGYAKSKGYTGTEEEFSQLMADYAEVGEDARSAANAAQNSAAAAATAEINAAASEGQAQAIADGLDARLDSQDAAIAAIRAAVGSPLVANTAAAMTDHDKIYVYTGTESGWTAGNWYYYDGTAWVSGGVYNSAAVETDTTLSVSGVPADAKAVGDEIDNVKSGLFESIEYHASPNLINFDDEDFLTGKYINPSNGALYNSESYNTSGYIPVEAGKTYTYSYGQPVGTGHQMRFICAFDKNKTIVSSAGADNRSSYTVPEGVAFIRFSADSANFWDKPYPAYTPCMFYEGTSIDQYYPYFKPYTTYTIKNNALDADYLNGLIDAKLTEVVTDYGLAIKATADSMTSSDTLTVVQRIDNKKNAVIEFLGYFESFTSLTLGHGYNVGYGNYAVIDDTHLTVYYGTTPTQMSQVSHGLTFSDFIHVVITQNNGARAKIQIITATGDYTLSDCSWDGCNGNVFAKVGSNMTNCVCSAIFKDFNEKVFLFGDSYVSMGDSARFPYYLVQNGYTHLLIDGYGGRNSASALVSFNNVLAKAVPKYAVWTLGMNDADTSSAVNASWLSCVESFIVACETNGIIPILATIPNCPNQRNTYKNAWVKASGHRYVDFAKAVGAESEGSSWYTGMLSNDNVHPTALGAKALYARFLSDVPEIIK